jgi:hypothetical protein
MPFFFLFLLAIICWYLALTKPHHRYPRDWRLKPFDLTEQEEQDFHRGTRQVIALTCAIFFSVLLILALILHLTGTY